MVLYIYYKENNKKDKTVTNDKIIWDDNKNATFKQKLISEKPNLDLITQCLVSGDINIDTAITKITDKLYNVAFTTCGVKARYIRAKNTKCKAPWFNGDSTSIS